MSDMDFGACATGFTTTATTSTYVAGTLDWFKSSAGALKGSSVDL